MKSKEALKKLYMTCDEKLLEEMYDIIFPSQLETIIYKDLVRLDKYKTFAKVVMDYLTIFNNVDFLTFVEKQCTEEEQEAVKEVVEHENRKRSIKRF